MDGMREPVEKAVIEETFEEAVVERLDWICDLLEFLSVAEVKKSPVRGDHPLLRLPIRGARKKALLAQREARRLEQERRRLERDRRRKGSK